MTIGTIILYPTNAGNDVQNRALAGDIPMPKISRVTASNGVPHADPYNATTLTGDISIAATKQAEQVAVERLSESAMRITAGFGPETHLAITQIGVWLDDGTLFAYGPLPTAFEKGDGVGVALPMVLSRSALDQIQLDINILDVNALGAQLVAMVMARVLGLSNSVVMELLAPLAQAVKYSWLAGSQKFQFEMFGFGFSMLDTEPLDITGARARDDSLDLAESASTLLSGDYLVFDAANAEQVRLLPAGNLDQGRRRLQWDLLHTYPATAQLARTNWTITPGNAACPAGGVYFSGRVRLTDGDVHRVYVYGLTAPGAPTVDWRTDAGEFVPAVLLESRVHEGEWSEYAFEVPAGQYFHLRVTTPTATRIRAIVACNTLRGVRVVTPPTIVGNAARPGEPVALALSAESRLVGGAVVQFDVVSAGLLTSHLATANAAVATLTLAGEAGEYRDIIATAVDDLGNRSLSIAHRIELRDDVVPPGPQVLQPTSGAVVSTDAPTLSAGNFLMPDETHQSTDWQVRADDGVTVVWQSPADTFHLTTIDMPSGMLMANTSYQVWVRYRAASSAVSSWSSSEFFVAASVRGAALGVVLVQSGITGGLWQRIDGDFNAVSTTAATFSAHPTYAGIVEQTIDGQAMVRIPAFWYRIGLVPSGPYAGKPYWMISDRPDPGFSLHPAFRRGASAPAAQFWVGKYQASTDAAGKLASVPGVYPEYAIDTTAFRARADGRNVAGVAGFAVWDIYLLGAIKMLALIEMASGDSQAQLGFGYTNQSYSAPEKTDNPIVASAGWRGIVGLWGNIAQFVDGVQIHGGAPYSIYIDHVDGSKAEMNTGLLPQQVGFTSAFSRASGSGYDLAPCFIAIDGGAFSSDRVGSVFPDFIETSLGVFLHGGGYQDVYGCGLFAYSMKFNSTASGYGARIAKR